MKLSLLFVDGLGNECQQYENLVKNLTNKIFKNINLNINSIIFLTSNTEYKNNDFIVYNIPKLNYVQYSNLLFNGLGNFFNDDKIIHIQTDGFCINEKLWTDDFLDYDYIGAPWPGDRSWTKNGPMVGNGGFSIRSKKLYELTSTVNFLSGPNSRYLTTNDDVFISHTIRSYLEENNIIFAPVELAKKFSVEIPISDDHTLDNSFGFHGKNYIEQHQFLRDYLK